MIIVKISSTEKDVIEKSMLEVGYQVKFYTMENNPNLVQCEIPCDDPNLMWHLGKMCGHAIAVDIHDKYRFF